MNKRKYCLILFNIVIFFIIFDGMRNNIIGEEFISPIKEFSIILLFIQCIKCNVKIKESLYFPFWMLWGYILIVGFVSVCNSDKVSMSNTILNILKFSMFFMLTICFMNFKKLTSRPLIYVYKKIVFFSICYCCLNILSVFMTLPIWQQQEMWYGRFGMGYPTTDTISLCMALIILLFKGCYFNYGKVKMFFIIVLINVGIIMQVTGTAIIVLPAIWCVYLVYKVFISKKWIEASIVVSLLLLCGSAINQLLSKELGERYEAASLLIDVKIRNFYKDEDVDNFDSKQARKDQFSSAQKRFIGDNEVRTLFGCGIHQFTMNQSLMSERYFHVENMFLLFVLCFGYWGTFLFIYCFLYMCVKTFSNSYSFESKCFLLSLCGVVIVANSALVSFYLIQVYGTMAVLVASLKSRL